jgi:uncharacterized protein YjbJ (UPF0337 family)
MPDLEVPRGVGRQGSTRVDNKAEELGGKVKEVAGKATDDERPEAEGKMDQISSNSKQAGAAGGSPRYDFRPYRLRSPRRRGRLGRARR